MNIRIVREMQSVGLVTLITLLIWLYAEGQDVRTINLGVTLVLPPLSGSNVAMDFANGQDSIRANVSVKGATTPLSEFQSHLAGGAALQLPVDAASLPEGMTTLDLRQLIGEARLNSDDPTGRTVTDLGISINSVDPAGVGVTTTQLVQRDLRVVFQPRGAQLAPSIKIEPPTLSVTLPRSVVERYATVSPDAMYVEAEVREEQLAGMPRDVEQKVTANLKPAGVLADVPHVRLSQRTAEVAFTIARQRDSLQLQLVPVWMLIPPSESVRYDVQLDEQNRVLRDLTITGPRDLIERLRTGEQSLRVVARIDLTGDMLDRGVTTVPISAIEIQQVREDSTQVLEVIPLNPVAMEPTPPPNTPTFLSANLSAMTANPRVSFSVTKETQ